MRYWHDCREGAVGWKKPFFRRDEAGQRRNLMRDILYKKHRGVAQECSA